MSEDKPTNNFIYYKSFEDATVNLSNEDLGILLRYMQGFAFSRIEPESFKSEQLRICYSLIKPQIEASQKHYRNGKLGGRPRKDVKENLGLNPGFNLPNNPCNNLGLNPSYYQQEQEHKQEYKQEQEYKQKKEHEYKHQQEQKLIDSASAEYSAFSRSRFVKPTIEELDAYIKEKGFTFKAEEFLDHYESNGWVIGSKNTPMKDWRAACRTWQSHRNEWHKNDKPDVDKSNDSDIDDLIAQLKQANR